MLLYVAKLLVESRVSDFSVCYGKASAKQIGAD